MCTSALDNTYASTSLQRELYGMIQQCCGVSEPRSNNEAIQVHIQPYVAVSETAGFAPQCMVHNITV